MMTWELEIKHYNKKDGSEVSEIFEQGKVETLAEVPRLEDFDWGEIFDFEKINPLTEDYLLTIATMEDDGGNYTIRQCQWLTYVEEIPYKLLCRKEIASEAFDDLLEAKRYYRKEEYFVDPDDFRSGKDFDEYIRKAEEENFEIEHAETLYELAEILTKYEEEEFFVREF